MHVNRVFGSAVVSAVVVGAWMLASGGTAQLQATPQSVRFTASGDFSSSQAAAAVLSGIGAIRPDLHLALGDLSYGVTGQEQAWCDFVTSRVGPGFPFELVAGNHESNGQNGNINDFSACLPNQLPGAIGSYGRQYYVDVPQSAPLVRFIMISPALAFSDGDWSYAAGTPRYLWTAAAIDSARAAGVPWVVVGMHKPCLSIGVYPCEPGESLLNLLVSKKVDLVLTGHEHMYQRTHQLATNSACAAVSSTAINGACIADSDATMTRGAGTVFATVGTGGVELRTVAPVGGKAEYFATASGLGSNPTFGSLDVSVTPSELRAAFVGVGSGTFTDAFVLGAGNGTTNLPPLSSFTAQCSLLDCMFDSNASTDSDGSIVSRTWDFGDGSIANGTTTTHSYVSAGEYTVALTVTDNSGAAVTATRVVAVAIAPPPPSSLLASDDFERTVSTGWGSAVVGGPWTVNLTNQYSVSGGFGRILAVNGAGRNTHLLGVSSTATVLTATIGTNKPATGSGLYVSMSPRRVDGAGGYVAKVRIMSNGQVSIEPMRVNASGGGEISLQAAIGITGLSYAVGDRLAVKVEASGTNPTTIRAKVWKVGTAEPATWQRSVTDSTPALQAAGGLSKNLYLSGSATNSPIEVTFDDILAVAP